MQICFKYTANNTRNKTIKGIIASESFTAAYALLQKQYFKKIKLTRLRQSSKIINPQYIATFTRQLATLQTAGVPLIKSLEIIRECSNNRILIQIITQIKNSIEAGNSLAKSLSEHADFDELFHSLIIIGESSGQLHTILQDIATYKEKAMLLKNKIKKAMYYPIFVLIVTSAVAAILLFKVVPTFRIMFEGLGAALPTYTKFILSLADNLKSHWGKLIIIVTILLAIIRNLTPYIRLRLPFFGEIIQKSVVARFAHTLAVTLAAGIPLQDALLLVAKASNNSNYNKAIINIHKAVALGSSINIAMRATKIFPPMAIQMVAIGEETGALNSMLQKIAKIYEEELDLAMDSITKLLEPITTLILGLIVGGLVIAMYMPIFNLGTIM